MNRTKIMGKATLPGNEQYKVVYNQYQDTVVLALGGTTVKLNAVNFMLMNEMIRKAAARLAIQTEPIQK